MLTPFSQAGAFLVQVIFDLYIFTMMLRAVLEWRGVNLRNPALRILITLTEKPLYYFRRVIPRYRGIDFAMIILLLSLEVIKLTLLTLLQAGVLPYLTGLLIYAFAALLSQLIAIFFWTIIAVVVLSWFSPVMYNPLIAILQMITSPLLNVARRYIPPISGWDLSPILVLVSLKFIEILLIDPLMQTGVMLALGVRTIPH